MGGWLGKVRCRILFAVTNVFFTHWVGKRLEKV